MDNSTLKGFPGSNDDAGPAKVVRSDLAAGQIIPGSRYRIVAKLGEGGMGTVYAAEHVDLERKVALKVLRADVATDAETLQQFRKEARAASKIGSAYICDVTDFGEVPDGRVFFVMEYLDGPSLGRVLRESVHIDPSRAIGILRQISKALGAVHEKAIVHLDVKPDNVMLVTRGKRADAVKMVDFGIAGLLHERLEEDAIAGTPEYIAPERASGKGFDHRSDIYSLGVVAYEMLSGTVPFHGRSNVMTLTMQVKDPPRPLAGQASQRIPEPLQALVMKMLDKDPAARPQNMAEVEALLCEAQIAAGLRTAWDDLELPAVDEERRERLVRRMPAPGGGQRKAVLILASGIAVVAAALALYLGVVRKPHVIIKEVRVEVTQTDEAPGVAAALLKADQAARRERYVRPPEDSAIHYIQAAESEASSLGRKSAGAATLRRAYASALTVIGNELVKAGLRDLAIPKYKEALLFLPEDQELQKKAELTPDEIKIQEPRGPASSQAPRPQAPAPAPVDNAREAATKVFVAATQRQPSQARLALKTLADFDVGGVQTARLADGLRSRAASEWAAGRYESARPLYEIVSQLDPQDLEARDRAKPGARPAAEAPAVVAPVPVAPAVANVTTVPKKKEKAIDPAREPAVAPEPEAPRDPLASQKAGESGVAAMARGRLTEAEQWFNRAVRADSTNAVGVGGLAEVAFERARYTEALDYARRAARLAPKASKYLVLLGDAYFKLLRYDEAQSAYQKSQALAPTDEGIKNRLARVQARLAR